MNRLLSRAAVVAGASVVLASPGIAPAQERSTFERQDRSDSAPYLRGGADAIQRQIARSTFSAEPAESTNPQNLPGKRENVDVISKLTFTGGPGGSVAPGQIADVAVHKNAAYLMSWSEPNCERGGFFSVDISDPARPRELKFVPALPDSYHGEGAHAISVDTTAFKGDLLVTNNEPCTANAPGGFDLYDVSDPANPTPLVQGAGDRGPDDGSLDGPEAFANSSHSSFLWQNGNRVFVVTVDNAELHDVDIFDVTNPRAPRAVGEFDLVEVAEAQGVDITGAEDANQGQVFLHDMVVKRINGRQTMLADYWDAGYVKLDVEDPANPRIISDSDFTGTDPETGAPNREGNAHQGEFSADNRYILAADEDFAPYRAGSFTVDGVGEFPSQEVGGGASAASLPDRTLNGPTVYVGYACDASDPVPSRDSVGLRPLSSGEEAIAVVQRGPVNDPENTEEACFPGEKAANANEAGYDAVLFVNRHTGSAEDDGPFCGSGGFPASPPIVSLCTSHEAYHRIFGSAPKHEQPYNQSGEPQIGDTGADVRGESVFDGWGYAHLYENTDGKLREVDTYSIQESRDPRFAFGFGDLSIHEWATDPEVPLAYGAYYAGGLRVVSFGPDGLVERGAYIDDRGNNFWGVEQFTDAGGNRLIALSDRDFGLYIVRYTGPGAPQPRRATPATPATPTQAPATPAQPAAKGPVVRISGRAIRLTRKGVATIAVGCPRSASGNCRARMRLVSGIRRLGRSRQFTVAPGKTVKVKVKFNKGARREVRKRKSMRVQITVDAFDNGGVRGVSTRRITVRPASAKLPSSRPK